MCDRSTVPSVSSISRVLRSRFKGAEGETSDYSGGGEPEVHRRSGPDVLSREGGERGDESSSLHDDDDGDGE